MTREQIESLMVIAAANGDIRAYERLERMLK